MPHVASLGADGMLLGPIFASVSHGYDTVTHQVVDERLGDVADLDAIVAAASSHGIGVVLDGAFAYASRAFWRLTDPPQPLTRLRRRAAPSRSGRGRAWWRAPRTPARRRSRYPWRCS
ncbi:alpha-amylase family glycosyl hydrolase [Pseudonocardia adelaidensis]|uniref:alpha-amylase family glycosyl hydrolase n=1 Tax=Pseudonocardia adelaidensis TaxID=648754 RepID=UPI003CD0895F